MADARVVLIKITGMFLVILAGLAARRRGWLDGAGAAALSRIVVDGAFPALVFVQMLRTVDAGVLRQEWVLPLLPFLLVAVALASGLALSPLLGGRERRPTALFLVTSPNWVFLPLPIAEALYGAPGVRVVLLLNVGAQLALWSVGVWILHGRVSQALRNLAGNIGLWATVAGIVLALILPQARTLVVPGPVPGSAAGVAVASLLDALAMLGSLTIPLSLFAIGAQIGGLPLRLDGLSPGLWGVSLARLLVAPLATVLGAAALARMGLRLPDMARSVVLLTAAMPVAIVCSVITERYGGDTTLAAQGVVLTTLLSILTVPGLFLLFS